MKYGCCVLLFFSLLLYGKPCPKALSGYWLGSYTDHGPIDDKIPILMHLAVHGDHFSGQSLALKQQSTQLPQFTLRGWCNKQIRFTTTPFTAHNQRSSLDLLNNDQMALHLYWQNAMIGGNGPALLEKINPHEVTQ